MALSCYTMPALQEGSPSSARFCSEVATPMQNSTSCNANAQGLFATRQPLSHRRSGLRLIEEDKSSTDATHDATQLAYEIMQHKITIERIANAFAV